MFANTLFAAASLIALASARVTGFSAPLIVAPDDNVRVEITVENFSQRVSDVATSFGLSPSNSSYPGSLGTLLSTKYLGPDFSNTLDNIVHYIHIPATTEEGNYTLNAAHFSLTGAVESASIVAYALNITVGGTTSPDYGNSTRVGNAVVTEE